MLGPSYILVVVCRRLSRKKWWPLKCPWSACGNKAPSKASETRSALLQSWRRKEPFLISGDWPLSQASQEMGCGSQRAGHQSVRVKPRRESWRNEVTFGCFCCCYSWVGGRGASPEEAPVLSQTFGRSQNISSEIDDSECERRGDSVYVEEPDEGKDGVTPRMGRVPAPCFLGCKSNPLISSGKNLQRKLKLL